MDGPSLGRAAAEGLTVIIVGALVAGVAIGALVVWIL